MFSTLGFNVGAILAGLGIGGFALAMASRETLADMLGGLMIFIERPFIVGDTIQINDGPTAKVVDMTWRGTRMVNGMNHAFITPNSHVSNSTISNFSKNGPVEDYVFIYVSIDHDPLKVREVIREALRSCDAILQDQPIGPTLGGVTALGYMSVMRYTVWWNTDNYLGRFSTRGKVWDCLWRHFKAKGIKLELMPSRYGHQRQVMH